MTTITIKQAQNYLLHATVVPIEAVPGTLHFKLESQWLDAKNPDGRQVKFDTTLTLAEARLIAEVLSFRI